MLVYGSPSWSGVDLSGDSKIERIEGNKEGIKEESGERGKGSMEEKEEDKRIERGKRMKQRK